MRVIKQSYLYLKIPKNNWLLPRRCNLEITKAVEILIKAKVNPNSTSKKNSTPPLFLAVEKVIQKSYESLKQYK